MFTLESYYTEQHHAANAHGVYVNVPVETVIKTVKECKGAALKQVFRNGKSHHYEVHVDGEFFSKNTDYEVAECTYLMFAE